jgi:hypothetical protein
MWNKVTCIPAYDNSWPLCVFKLLKHIETIITHKCRNQFIYTII